LNLHLIYALHKLVEHVTAVCCDAVDEVDWSSSVWIWHATFWHGNHVV